MRPPLSEMYSNILPKPLCPLLAKHSKSFSLIDCISLGVDRMQVTEELRTDARAGRGLAEE